MLSKLIEIARIFFGMGCVAFGGPAAHIAMMEDIIVDKKKWMSREHFLDLVGATNLIPGPNSTEMTMHCGHERAGTAGLFVAGISFIFPAAVMTGILAYVYVTYGQTPYVEPFLYGIKPAVLILILNAVIKLGKKALKGWQLGLIGLAVGGATFLGLSEIYAILAGGILWMLKQIILNITVKDQRNTMLLMLFIPQQLQSEIPLGKLFLVFLKIGAILFGSGYVLIAYLDGELIQRLGWLSRQELLDAVAIGQMTPGPVLTTATFIGYQLAGWKGAILATVGIFLPSFFFVWFLNPLIPRLRKSKLSAAFLDGVNIGAVGIMGAVMIELGVDILIDWRAIVIASLSALAVFGPKKTNPIVLVIGAALLGYGLSWL